MSEGGEEDSSEVPEGQQGSVPAASCPQADEGSHDLLEEIREDRKGAAKESREGGLGTEKTGRRDEGGRMSFLCASVSLHWFP